MEQIRPTHIEETQKKDLLEAQTEYSETGPFREEIIQTSEYGHAQETHPEQIKVREYLSTIDEGVLKEIFQEYLRKAGNDNETISWIPIDSVRIELETQEDINSQTSTTGHYINENGITIVASTRSTQEFQQVLWTLIHEELHAVSATNSVEYGEDTSKKRTVWKSGVSSMTHVNEQTEDGEPAYYSYKIFTNINEGITESITERIYREYIVRTGDERISHNDAEQYADRRYVIETYGKYQEFLDSYILLLAAQSEVPIDTVRDSVIRTYLRNGQIVPEELFDNIPVEEMEKIHAVYDIVLDADISIFEMLDGCQELGIINLKQKIDFLNKYDNYLDTQLKRINRSKP
jgi:hypothetical protein